jgi:hypothetical protein
MKKLTAMLLTLCFAMMIVGCGEETKKPAGGDKKPAAAPAGEKKDK